MATIVLAGGGTGGHVYPAMAIGEALRDRGHEVIVYGDPTRLEGIVAPKRGFPFRPVRALQYPRGGLVGKVIFAWGLLRSVLATRKLLKADRVDIVLGVGGYISAPPVLSAWTLRIPRFIHEANVVPGLANRLCARVATGMFLTYEKTRHRLGGRGAKHVVGVPVNPAVMLGDRIAAATRYSLDPKQPTVLLVGGSLGAQRINDLAMSVIQVEKRAFQVLVLCGPKYYEEMNPLLEPRPQGVCLVDYEHQMADAYEMADLVVCRAGSSTLAELCAVGKASLLVPSANVTENHQEENARGLESVGAAEVLVEHGWDLPLATDLVVGLITDGPRLDVMAQAASGQKRLDAAKDAADLLEQALESTR